jgi:hypothetical protein
VCVCDDGGTTEDEYILTAVGAACGFNVGLDTGAIVFVLAANGARDGGRTVGVGCGADVGLGAGALVGDATGCMLLPPSNNGSLHKSGMVTDQFSPLAAQQGRRDNSGGHETCS